MHMTPERFNEILTRNLKEHGRRVGISPKTLRETIAQGVFLGMLSATLLAVAVVAVWRALGG